MTTHTEKNHIPNFEELFKSNGFARYICQEFGHLGLRQAFIKGGKSLIQDREMINIIHEDYKGEIQKLLKKQGYINVANMTGFNELSHEVWSAIGFIGLSYHEAEAQA